MIASTKHIFWLICLLTWASSSFAQNYIPVQKASDEEWIDLRLEGAFDKKVYKEVIDSNGIYYGKCIIAEVKNNQDSDLYIVFPNGTELYCNDSSTQNIILTKDVPVLLSPKQKYRFKLYGMSTEFGDEIPRKGVTYDLGLVGSRFLRLTKRIEHDAMQNQIGQCALWAFIGKFDRSSFLKYYPDEKLLNKVIQLLDSSGVKTILNKKSGSNLSILLSQQNQQSKGQYEIDIPVSGNDKNTPSGFASLFSRENIGYGFMVILVLLFIIYYILLVTGAIAKLKNYMYPQDFDDDIDGLGDLA